MLRKKSVGGLKFCHLKFNFPHLNAMFLHDLITDAVLSEIRIKLFIYNCDCFRLDDKSHGRGSMSSDPKAAPESDTDSMAEYGDGDTGW